LRPGNRADERRAVYRLGVGKEGDWIVSAYGNLARTGDVYQISGEAGSDNSSIKATDLMRAFILGFFGFAWFDCCGESILQRLFLIMERMFRYSTEHRNHAVLSLAVLPRTANNQLM